MSKKSGFIRDSRTFKILRTVNTSYEKLGKKPPKTYSYRILYKYTQFDKICNMYAQGKQNA